ncbi:MAG: hypothetical protein ACLFWD_03460 [Anaerolineales bacterium]
MADGPIPRRLWWAALGMFCLAALTGAAYRWSMWLGPLPRFSLVNLRHAHSHLMYMGWATPAAAILISSLLSHQRKDEHTAWHWAVALMIFSAAAAYPVFLRFGYQPVPIGEAHLPLAALIGGVNIIAWYAWMIQLRSIQRQANFTMATQLWTLAGFFLLLSSFGAWFRGMLPRLGLTDPLWGAISLHWFLDMLAEGWLLLAVLGLMYQRLEVEDGPGWANYLLFSGLPLAFLLGIPAGQLPLVELRWLARAAGALVALGTAAHIIFLWQAAPVVWRIPMGVLMVKAALQLADALIGSSSILAAAGLRLLHLHLLLVGGFSLGAWLVSRDLWGPRSAVLPKAITASVLLLLTSLVPLTELWPAAWSGRWTLALASVAATLPPTVVLAGFVKSGFGLRERANSAS